MSCFFEATPLNFWQQNFSIEGKWYERDNPRFEKAIKALVSELDADSSTISQQQGRALWGKIDKFASGEARRAWDGEKRVRRGDALDNFRAELKDNPSIEGEWGACFIPVREILYWHKHRLELLEKIEKLPASIIQASRPVTEEPTLTAVMPW